MSVADIDLFELNEAFAAVGVASMEELGITDEVTNVNGGAISSVTRSACRAPASRSRCSTSCAAVAAAPVPLRCAVAAARARPCSCSTV